jgi:hypothetical protein
VVGSALTLAVFFLALWLLPFETFSFPSRDFLGFSDFGRVGTTRDLKNSGRQTFIQKLRHDNNQRYSSRRDDFCSIALASGQP